MKIIGTPEADYVERRGVGQDVIANFHSQSDAILEPPIPPHD